MRLGDLDALSAFVGDLRSTLHKEQSTFKSMTQSEFEIKDSMLLSFQYAIDNAPIVEPCYQTTSCLDCKMYDKEKHNCPRFCEIIRSAIEEKPQDECKGGFQLTELRRWLTSQGYSEGTVDDKINEFTGFVERIRGEE